MPPSAQTMGTDASDEYRIVRSLGSGDHEVFLAHDRKLDRAVVLHLLPADPALRVALLESARALASVMHPSLCRVHRIRERGEPPCVVQSFERGGPMSSHVGRLAADEVRAIGGAVASALAAMHAVGVAHGGVAMSRIVLPPSGPPCLIGLRTVHARASTDAMTADVTALIDALAQIAEPDLRRELERVREVDLAPRPAEELRRILGDSAEVPGVPGVPGTSSPEGDSPYRGLRAFDVADSRLFFGRDREAAELLAQLRDAPWALVTGPSGSGKSSLVRAGIVPAVGDLGEREVWDTVAMTPGRQPLDALGLALAGPLGRTADDLIGAFRRDPSSAGRLARARSHRGLLVVVDQLEECMTVADASERDAFLSAIAGFGALSPGVRAILTLRSDFLDRFAATDRGTIARDLLRAAYVLPPMRADALRLAVVGPARARGFEMETPGMVERLVAEGHADLGTDGLSLLSFVLAELWGERDRARRVLPEAALTRLGGAAAALARHGDNVLATLTTTQRQAARRCLLSLVTASGTRAQRTRGELLGAGGDEAEIALEALIHGRLVVAGETYELAHEALVRAWPRLRAWIDEASDARLAAQRLDAAAAEWERQGRSPEALWNALQLVELESIATGPRPPQVAAFVAASRAAARRAAARRWSRRVAVPAAGALVVGCIFVAFGWRQRLQTRQFVEARLGEADIGLREIAARDDEVRKARAAAFDRFDADDAPGGEARWKDALAAARREADAFAAASAPMALALARDPGHAGVRARAADLTYAWILAAERDRDADLLPDLESRLERLDVDGTRRAKLDAPAHLQVTADAPGAVVILHDVHLDLSGRRVEDTGHAIALGASLALRPGSYVVSASAPGRYPTRLPVLLTRGREERVAVPMPRAADVPAGFLFVPAGASIVGSRDAEAFRAALSAEPEHDVWVDEFVIKAEELTYGEYIDFLGALPAAERDARRPHGPDGDLRYDGGGVPVLTIGQHTARRGEPLCRPTRTVRRCQDWLRFPVAYVSWEDAGAYAAWLSRGKVPGARLCTEREWERAARGADGRLYAHGDELHGGDANFEETYLSDRSQLGADEVGSFPVDRSPFGVLDLVGNLGEWTLNAHRGMSARGGNSAMDSLGSRLAFRYSFYIDRSSSVGIRLCAGAPVPPERG